MTKTCSKCKQTKPTSDFAKDNNSKDKLTSWCKDCRNAKNKQYYLDNPEKQKALNDRQKQNRKKFYDSEAGRLSSRRSHLKRRFNITLEDYDVLLKAQNGKCKICGQKHMDSRYKYLAVDHDHKTGEIRGLLCGNCNLALGNFKDDPKLLKKAIKYLTKK